MQRIKWISVFLLGNSNRIISAVQIKIEDVKHVIAITGMAAISAADTTENQLGKHALSYDDQLEAWVGKLPSALKAEIEAIRAENRNYQALDASVLYAMYVSRLATQQAGWQKESDFGINIGSSRGATQLFEQYFEHFLQNNKSEPLASPTTTLATAISGSTV